MNGDHPEPFDHDAETSESRRAQPPPAPAAESARPPMPSRIGHYTIKSFIAEGGMSAVYLAVQEQPRRTVALKLMKSGIASRSALRRFEFESQILGRLHHPNIAQVYEAGTHDDGTGGVPYFGLDIGKTTAWVAGRDSPIPGGEWHHLAGEFDGDTVRLFVNGKQVATAEASGNQPRSGVDLHVGAQCDDHGQRSAYFRGCIDELRISRIARYGEGGFVPVRRHEPDADTVVLLHFDAAFGPFTPDHSGSVAHGCRRGGVSFVPVEPAKTD